MAYMSMFNMHLSKLLWMYCLGYAGFQGQIDWRESNNHKRLASLKNEVLRSLRHSRLKGRERTNVNQTNIGTVSKATLGKLLRDGVERTYNYSQTFLSVYLPS